MSKEIAVAGCTYKITPSTVTGVVAPVTAPSTSCFIDNKGIYRGAVQVSVSGVTQGAYVVPTPVIVTLTSSDSETMTDGMATLLKGDAGNGSGVGVEPIDGNTQTITFTVTIDDPGQAVVLDDV